MALGPSQAQGGGGGGGVSTHDIVDVIDEEAKDDILKLAGVRNSEVSSLYNAIISTANSRFPWLAVNLATAFLASGVVGMFEHLIDPMAHPTGYQS